MDNAEYQKLILLYASYGITLFLSLIPTTVMAVLTIGLAVAVLMLAYHLRKYAAAGSILHNHAHFTIRSVWIGSIFGLATTAMAGIYMFIGVDPGPMMPCMEEFVMVAGDTPEVASEQMMAILQPCMQRYMSLNKDVFVISFAVAIVPVLIYFFVRFVRGLRHALRKEAVPDAQRWL